jgi:hypothetical protein
MVLARKDFDLGQCPLMALSGHASDALRRLLSGVKRTSTELSEMSAYDPKRTSSSLHPRVWD